MKNKDTQDILPDWGSWPFESCILPNGVEKKPSVQQNEYKMSGPFPIVDQGAVLISGYTDTETVVHKDLPIILFGDHTRIFKFVDFPFATGADGTKLLRPNNKIVDSKFLYYSLLSFEIPSKGYSRHFKYLKEKSILAPNDLTEQKAIAAILSKIQMAMEVQGKLIAKLKELKAATMAKLFCEGLHGEPLKQTEIGEIPESWEVKRFGDFTTLQRGYDLPVQNRRYGNVPVIGSNGLVGYHDKAMVNGPGVCTGRSGTMGLSFYSEKEFWPLNTALFVVDFHGNNPLFVHYFFQRFNFRQFAGGVSVPTLNRNLVHEVLIAVPKPEQQFKIANVMKAIDRKIELEEKMNGILKLLFSSTLHFLMTGQIRVTTFSNSKKLSFDK